MAKRIGELLVEAGGTTEDNLRVAPGHQKAEGGRRRVAHVLLSMGAVTPAALARALAAQAQLPFVELPEVPARVAALVPLDFQAEQRVVPFRLDAEAGAAERLHL